MQDTLATNSLRMMKDSARREWNYVLVYKLDRFSRDKYATAIHKKTLKDHGVKVLSAMENIPDTPEGIILESLLEGMNQYYSAELSQKVKRGMRETRLKGNYQGGGIPYGYTIEGRKIVIDEPKAEVVQYMYEQFSKGVYVRQIIAELTARGVLYHGRPFAKNTVYNILKNDKYSGVYDCNGETVANMYPQIIPTEIFERVRSIVNANKHGKRSVAVVYLLRGKLKCGYCGESVIAECGTSKDGEKRYYYKCRGRKARVNDCQKSVIQKDALEKLIIELQREQRQNEIALDNIMAAIERGIMNNTTSRRMKELETRQEELERLILIEQSKQAVKVTERDIKAFYEQALRLEPQMLINYLIKGIVFFDDRIEIYFNSPIRNNPDDSQGFSFNRQSRVLQDIIVTIEIFA